ncbi:MAG: hypothetical protein ACRDGQ_14900 [Candidatus Limnocylindrales bacterium]
MALPDATRRGLWLPIHLGLAGAAGTAIASALPFFSASLGVVGPARRSIRIAAIGLIAGGALAVAGGVMAGGIVAGGGAAGGAFVVTAGGGVAGGAFVVTAESLAVAGGLAYLAGLVAVVLAVFGPFVAANRVRQPLLLAAYGVAIADVLVGVVLATGLLAGDSAIAGNWLRLKPAHGWLNVFGFLSLIVAATLVHLAPTIAGTRIVPRRSALVLLAGLGAGAPLVALGFALGSDPIARLGALFELAGAIALVIHAVAVQRAHGNWTTDPAWHRMIAGSLIAGPGWLLGAMLIGAGRVLWLGSDPAAWTLTLVAAPLAIGWIVQVLIGAWSHLLPAVGPGDRAAHSRQRVILGWAATPRLLALNLGVGLVVAAEIAGPGAGWPNSLGMTLGIALGAAALAAGIATFALAARLGLASGGGRVRS